MSTEPAQTPPQPEPTPFARAMDGNYLSCDYPEDAAHENGNYANKCQCGAAFIGHKRRMLCKVCAETPQAPPQPEPQQTRTSAITFYELRFYMFSNFSSFAVEYNGRLWPTSEHAYQAAKFLEFDLQEKVRQQTSAHAAMKLAQSMEDKYRPSWHDSKVRVMLEICRAKLYQHHYIQRKLLETGDRELIESSPIDSFWGWGPNKDGQNHLGKIWMLLREELKNIAPKPDPPQSAVEWVKDNLSGCMHGAYLDERQSLELARRCDEAEDKCTAAIITRDQKIDALQAQLAAAQAEASELLELVGLASASFAMLEAYLGPQWFEAVSNMDLVGPDKVRARAALAKHKEDAR